MFKGFGQSGGKGAMAAGAFAAAVLAVGVWIAGQRDLPDEGSKGAVAVLPSRDATPANATLEQNAVQGASIGPKGTAATEPDAEKAQAEQAAEPPAFDEVRRDPDGVTVIAGRAAPGSTVSVLNDGEEVANATADGAGKFATLVIIPPDGQGHVLTLLGQNGAEQVASAEEILLAPSAAPVEVEKAEAVTEPVEGKAEAALENGGFVPPQTDEGRDVAALTDKQTAPAPSEPSEDKPLNDPENGQPDAASALDATVSETASEDIQTDDSVTERDVAPSMSTETAQESIAEDSIETDSDDAVTRGASPDSDGVEIADAAATDSESGAQEGGTDALADSGASAQRETPAERLIDTLSSKETASDRAQAKEVETPPAATDETAEAFDPQADTEGVEDETSAAASPAKPSAPAPVLKSTADGVERIDTAPPQVMTNVALDTIGYSDQGDVQLAGRAQPDTSEVRVYLNNNAVISLPVDQEGRWRGDLPNVDEGIYTLRVDELSAGGDVTSRVETPFKRESAETLAAASAGVDGPLSAVTVQKGDTLWAISRERYGDPLLYVQVFEANSENIRDPDLIYPGQVFDLPDQTAPE